ncbi:MAG: hypothetical protein HQL64_01240 [Magnetococcales bacterium]|nr:hypothetical protein [Magnetococcales bacterium]
MSMDRSTWVHVAWMLAGLVAFPVPSMGGEMGNSIENMANIRICRQQTPAVSDQGSSEQYIKYEILLPKGVLGEASGPQRGTSVHQLVDIMKLMRELESARVRFAMAKAEDKMVLVAPSF